MNTYQANARKLVNAAFLALQSLNNHGFTSYRDRLFDLCREEERRHRGRDFGPYHPQALGVSDCARFFAVYRVAQALTEGRKRWPFGKDYLHSQLSWFYAVALADEYGPEIRANWRKAGVKAADLVALDYCELVTPKEEAK